MSLIYSYIANLLLLKSKKFGNISSFILAIFLGIYAGNMPLNSMDDVAQSDIRSYFGNYNNPYSTNFEVGYRTISHFFAGQGVDYYSFRIIFSIIMMLLLWFVVSKISEYHAMAFFSFYTIFPFFVDTIQFRTMIASIFIVLAYQALIANHKVLVILLLLCGTLFQTLTIVFLLVIPLHILYSEKAFKSIKTLIYYVIIPMIGIFFGYVFGLMRVVVNLVATISGRNDLVDAYTRLSSFRTGWDYILVYTIAFIIELVIIYTIYNDKKIYETHKDILKASAPFLIIGMYALPIIRFYTDINRFYRLSEIILFVLVTVYLTKDKTNNIRVKNIMVFISTLILTILSGYVFYRGSDFPHIVNILQLNG